MNGTFLIEFRQGDGAVARMLAMVDGAGLPLRGIRLIPAARGERMTLRLDLGERTDGELRFLEEQMLRLDTTIEVIHRASRAMA